MKTIALYQILEQNGYVESGNIVFAEAKDIVLKGEVILIDMSQVESVPTNFLNTFIGALIDLYGIERTKKSLRFSNILKSQVERIRKYFNDYESVVSSLK
jgi:STAS-like domain of unknown function (DUF4325)